MAPRKNNLIPDMRETRYKTETFANPYAPVAPKQTAFRTPKMSTAIPYGLTASEYKAYTSPADSNPIFAWIEQGGGNYNARSRAIGKVDAYNQGLRQAADDKNTMDLFGKTVKTSDVLSIVASAALAGAGIYAARSGMRVRASNRSLAASRVANTAAIAANKVAARAQGRKIITERQEARRNRRASTVRIRRLEQIEANLRDRDPLLAQAAGDRAWAIRTGQTIRTVLRGKKGHANTRMPRTAIGHHHGMHVPLEDAVPSDYYQQIWKREIGARLNRRLGTLYQSGNPMITRSSGSLKRPNLRTRTPIRPRDVEGNLRGKEQVDDATRDQIVQLLDEATIFRNRSSSLLQGTPATGGRGRYAFPRSYDELVTYPSGSFDPAKYQLDAFDSYINDVYKGTKKVKPKPKRLKGGD
jgi:hypothetical protein